MQQTKKFTIYFGLNGYKFKKEVDAVNEDQAKFLIMTEIKFHEIREKKPEDYERNIW